MKFAESKAINAKQKSKGDEYYEKMGMYSMWLCS